MFILYALIFVRFENDISHPVEHVELLCVEDRDGFAYIVYDYTLRIIIKLLHTVQYLINLA